MVNPICSMLPEDFPWGNRIHLFDCLPSTNDYAKELARQGAPHGTVIVADMQTAGRGRMGRSFHAPKNQGLYLSLILRPECPPDQLMHLTCAVAEAACNAVEQLCGIRPQIKWINDLIMGSKKLGGILTELSVDPKTGLSDWAVIGIGINCYQDRGDFPPELQDMATSLLLSTGSGYSPYSLACALIRELYDLSDQLLSGKDEMLKQYRQDCLTIGKEISVSKGGAVFHGKALDIDSDGGLIVMLEDGTIQTVQAGEVSVRGLYGYV